MHPHQCGGRPAQPDGAPTGPGHVTLVVRPGLIIEAPHADATVRLAPRDRTRPATMTGARRVIPT